MLRTRPWILAGIVCCVWGLLDIWIASRIHLGIHEAQIALAGRFVAWGYVNHAPLSGWLQWGVQQLSTADIALRFFPVAGFALTSFLLFILTLHIFKAVKIAWTVLLIWWSVPLNQLASITVSSEGLMLPLAMLLLVLLHLQQSHRSIVASVAVPIVWTAAFLSHFAAIMLLPPLLAMVVADRKQYNSAAFGVGVLVAVAVLVPSMAWYVDAQYFEYWYQQAVVAGIGAATAIALTVQLLVIGPALFFGGMYGVFALRRHARLRCILYVSVVGIGLTIVVAAFGNQLMLLPLLGWATTSICTAALANVLRYRFSKTLWWLALVLSISIALLCKYLIIVQPTVSLGRNMFADVVGWKTIATQLQSYAAEHPQQIIFTARWQDAARLAWYSNINIVVIDDVIDQYDAWFGSPVGNSSGLLVVYAPHDPALQPAIAAQFSGGCIPLQTDLSTLLQQRFALYECDAYQQ